MDDIMHAIAVSLAMWLAMKAQAEEAERVRAEQEELAAAEAEQARIEQEGDRQRREYERRWDVKQGRRIEEMKRFGARHFRPGMAAAFAAYLDREGSNLAAIEAEQFGDFARKDVEKALGHWGKNLQILTLVANDRLPADDPRVARVREELAEIMAEHDAATEVGTDAATEVGTVRHRIGQSVPWETLAPQAEAGAQAMREAAQPTPGEAVSAADVDTHIARARDYMEAAPLGAAVPPTRAPHSRALGANKATTKAAKTNDFEGLEL